MDEFLDSFKKYLSFKGKSSATKRAYLKDLEQFKKSAGAKHPMNIGISEIDDFKRFLKLNDYKNETITRKLNSINAFFKWLKSRNVIENNPIDKVPYPKSMPRKQRILTEAEYSKILLEARNDIKSYTIISMLLYTGMKISELHDLTLADIDLNFKRPQIHVSGTETGISRNVPLIDKLLFILNTFVKEFHPADSMMNTPLFKTSKNNPILVRNLRQMIDKVLKKSDVYDVKVNDIRNTFIVNQLQHGNSVSFVAKMVGHKSLKATERYLRFVENYEDKRVDKVVEF